MGKKTNEEYIKEANLIHDYFFDYSLSKYNGHRSYIDIICPVHGVFTQRADSHLKSGCKKCFFDKIRFSNDEFIRRAIDVQGNRYDYSLVEYINCTTKVKIICETHGVFEQLPDNHLSKRCGCPFCKESQGEKRTSIFLDKNNIKYFRQYKFEDCRNINPLPFDFYLPDLNLCIEYDGKQHYDPESNFGLKGNFNKITRNDRIKDDFCELNDIKLVRIKYSENIDFTLKHFLMV